MGTLRFDPMFTGRVLRIARLLGLRDRSELAGALDDIASACSRYHFHFAAQRSEKTWRRQDAARRRIERQRMRITRRGRPHGSADWARIQLGLELATIWRNHRLQAPTRSYDVAHYRARDTGFRRFLLEVLEVLPAPERPMRKGRLPDVDHLVRVSISEFHDAQRSPEISRQNGLLEEHRWLR